MPIRRDIESSIGSGKREPLIKKDDGFAAAGTASSNGSIGMVLLSTAVAVCGSIAFGSCIGYSAPTQAGIMEDIGLSPSQYAIFGSILSVSAMIGAITSGRIADYVGRKGAMRTSAGASIIGWIVIYFAKDALMLYVGRFSTGYGMGVFSYVVPVFIAEIAPKNLRGGLTTLNQLLIVSGSSAGFIFGTFVTWRSLALIGILPSLVLLVGLLFIPESPRWLAKFGSPTEFKAALQSLRGKDANIAEEAEAIDEVIKTMQSLPRARLQDLFQSRYIRSIIVGVGLMVCQQFGGVNAICFYASETFVSAGFSSSSMGNILMGSIQVPITGLGAYLMDKTGRRPLLMASASGTFLGTFLTGLSFYFRGQVIHMEWVPALALSGILVYMGAFSIGMGAIPWVIMSEIFPINIKGLAGSLVTLVSWFGSWIMTYAFSFLMSWSASGTFFLFAGVCASTVLFVARFVPETKNRTLEEIQASMNS